MKMKIKLLSALLSAAMCLSMVSLAGCGGNSGPEPRDVDFEISAERQAEMDKESNTIRVLFPGLDRSADEWRNKAVARFEQDTGKKVEYIPAGFSMADNTEKIYASIAAQNPYDAVWTANSDYPLYYVKQYTQPIGDYLDMEMLQENVWVNMTIMDEFCKFNGEYYMVVPYNFVNPFLTFYNKDLIEEYDLEDPKELYEKNEWTVEKMHEMAYKVQRDLDGDGVLDVYGITSLYLNLWQSMNHTGMVTTDSNGKFTLNFDDPALMRSFDYLRDATFEKDIWDNLGNTLATVTFSQGKHLFMLEPYWSIWELYTTTDKPPAFEWDVVPLPYGADNTEHYNCVSCGGMCFINGCPSPYTTATLIEYICQEDMYEQKDNEANYGEYLTEERKELKEEMIKKPFYNMSNDGLLPTIGLALLNSVMRGEDNSSVVEEWRAEYTTILDGVNTEVAWPDPVDHEPYTFDFENDIDSFTLGENVKDGTISQTTGDEALDGKGSLKIEFNPETNAKTINLATLSDEYRLYGYTTYKISFDYKVVGEIAEDTEYFLAYYSTQSKTQRDAIYFKPESSPNSEVRHAEITFEPVADNETVFTMLIGCKKAPGTVIIDNMKIEQIRQS